jgi:hypothetical protein
LEEEEEEADKSDKIEQVVINEEVKSENSKGGSRGNSSDHEE